MKKRAVYDQQGSRWTDQAQRLNGRIGSFTIKPDQFQAVNPILIVILVPLFDAVIYPLFAKIGLLKRLLQRIGAGIIFAMLSFAICAFLEWQMQNSYTRLNPSEQIKLFNTLSCKLKLIDPAKGNSTILTMNEPDLKSNQVYQLPAEYLDRLFVKSEQSGVLLTFKLEGDCLSQTLDLNITNQYRLSTLVLYASNSSSQSTPISQVNIFKIPFNIRTQEVGKSQVNFIQFDPENAYDGLTPSLKTGPYEYDTTSKLALYNPDLTQDTNLTSHLKDKTAIDYSEYSLRVKDGKGDAILDSRVVLETCGSYSILLFKNKANLDFVMLTNIHAIDIHLAWQIVQIFVITVSEIMFSISGVTFAYSQAPPTMKSVLQATWYMTVAFGNLIVVIVAESKFVSNQVMEYLVFVGLLAIALAIFTFLSFFYVYVEDAKKNEKKKKDDDDEKKREPDLACIGNSGDDTVNVDHVNYGFYKEGFEKHPTELNLQKSN